jgi:cardiolipin synthase (CMP-forming)
MPDGVQLERASSKTLLNIPNLISFGRLCAVPLAFWLVIDHALGGAFILFVLAGASDAVDGWLARRAGVGNAIGAVLDPMADKALLVTMYVTLAAIGAVPDWLAILVVFRDLIIVGGFMVLVLAGHSPAIRPLFVSKVNTTLQIILLGLTLFLAGFGVAAPGVALAMNVLTWVVAATTLASGGAYVWGALGAK